MEPVSSQMRMILVLGKVRIVERQHTRMKLALGGSTTMEIFSDVLEHADVKAGDVLTLYTEVLYANPQSTSIQ